MLIQENMAILDFLDVFLFEKYFYIYFDFNQFISLYKVNSPFLTEEILKGLNKIREEYQSCFDSFYLYHSNLLNKETDPKVTIELSKKSIQSLNKLRNNDPFKQIEELLIAEMKKDLRIFE